MPTATTDQVVRILLVEDNPGDAVLTRKVLEEITTRISVTTVGDGERAISILRPGDGRAPELEPDLILLDINLPRMSGHEVLAELKRDERLRRIPVVALTSSSAEADISANVRQPDQRLHDQVRRSPGVHGRHALHARLLVRHREDAAPGLARSA